jgi:hypothetical protein
VSSLSGPEFRKRYRAEKNMGFFLTLTQTFTNWVNVHLADRNLKIADLAGDLSDGVMLVNLLEVISAKRFPRYNKNTKFQSQKLENVSTCLKFLKDEGIKLVAIGPEGKCLTVFSFLFWFFRVFCVFRSGAKSGDVFSNISHTIVVPTFYYKLF